MQQRQHHNQLRIQVQTTLHFFFSNSSNCFIVMCVLIFVLRRCVLQILAKTTVCFVVFSVVIFAFVVQQQYNLGTINRKVYNGKVSLWYLYARDTFTCSPRFSSILNQFFSFCCTNGINSEHEWKSKWNECMRAGRKPRVACTQHGLRAKHTKWKCLLEFTNYCHFLLSFDMKQNSRYRIFWYDGLKCMPFTLRELSINQHWYRNASKMNERISGRNDEPLQLFF